MRGSGKSTMIRWMINRLNSLKGADKPRWDFGFACTPTAESSAFFKEIFGPCFVREKFDKDLIATAIEIAKALDRRKKKRKWLVAVDDCGYDKQATKGEIMR
jgi:hypothetical protein